MKFILVLFALLLCCSTPAPAEVPELKEVPTNTADESYSNEPDGFRGIPWGASLASVKGLTFVLKDDEDVKYYTRKADQLTVGAAKVKSIAYGFWKGKFYSATFKFKGSHNWKIIIGTLLSKFSGDELPAGSQYIWRGPATGITATFNEVSMEGTVAMMSSVVQSEISSALEKIITDNSDKGF